jgi:hypothetical protein
VAYNYNLRYLGSEDRRITVQGKPGQKVRDPGFKPQSLTHTHTHTHTHTQTHSHTHTHTHRQTHSLTHTHTHTR